MAEVLGYKMDEYINGTNDICFELSDKYDVMFSGDIQKLLQPYVANYKKPLEISDGRVLYIKRCQFIVNALIIDKPTVLRIVTSKTPFKRDAKSTTISFY